MALLSVDDAIHEFCTLQKSWLETELRAGEEEESEPARSGGDDESSQKGGKTATKKKPQGGGTNAPEGPSASSGRHAASILTKLESLQISVGLYGRTVVQLGRRRGSGEELLPVHTFTTGDEVEIRNNSKTATNGGTIGGVVCEVTETSLSVALFSSSGGQKKNKGGSSDETAAESFFDAPPYTIIPRSNVQVHEKMVSALSELRQHGVHHPVAGKVVETLFRKVEFPPWNNNDENEPTFPPFNPRLDASQLAAISFVLSSKRPVALIHGPPGTGKTTTVAELIQQAVRYRQMKVLVVAASNVAVDTLLARLVADGGSSTKQKQQGQRLRVVRLGHPARLQPAILPYCLEALVQKADGTEIVQDVRDELQQYLQILARPRDRDKRIAAREVKALRKEIRTREEKVVSELIHNANVVLATCVGAANTKLLTPDVTFDLVVIDEAAQALEAACWIAILRGRKLVLAGDHCQLPPTIMSTTVQRQLGVTLFERTMRLYGEKNGGNDVDNTVSRMLKVQYRMNENIANWASECMYGGALATFTGIRHQTIAQLEGVVATDNKEIEKTGEADEQEEEEEEFPAMLLIDTAGCDLLEGENASGSRYNEGEADLVVTHVQKLLARGVPPEEVAVISPYNGQVELLRLRLLPDHPKLQIRSVDGFQGGEREAVVISLVRSHPFGTGTIGFLRDDRRLNVAITRAKRHCCVICDTDTVTKSPFIKSLVDWIDEHGVHQTADGDPIEGDLAAVERQLETFIGKPRRDGKPFSKTTQQQQRAPYQQKDEEYIATQHVALKSRIEAFVTSAKPGETMIMSRELSKLDRKIVHEIAEEFGIEHVSYGEEGARQIHLKMPPAPALDDVAETSHLLEVAETPADASGEDENEAMDTTNGTNALSDDEQPQPTKTIASFAILADDAIDEQDQQLFETTSGVETTSDATNPPTLADLARERQQRATQSKPQQVNAINPKPKINIASGKRLGGTKKKPPPRDAEKVDNASKDLDDMAFLDAQIDQVQNSHGIAFEGKGKTYRTVVNGILLHKNKAPEPKKNAKAVQSLQTKLQDEQKQRAAKPKKR